MEASRPIEEIIRERYSCRSFLPEKIEADKMDALLDFMEESTREAEDIGARFTMVQSLGANGNVGTYGMISGARDYMVGIVKKGGGRIEDFGYLFEKIVLYAASLNLDTCWLAGIDRKTFESKMSLSDGETVAVACPVGYAKRGGIKDGFIRLAVRADKRKPWKELFFEGGPVIPLSRERAGVLAVPLEMARLAPSASNRQPWRIIVDGGNVHFCLQRTRGYLDRGYPIDVQKNDIGISMCHFDLSARSRGLEGVFLDMQDAETGAFEYIRTWRKK